MPWGDQYTNQGLYRARLTRLPQFPPDLQYWLALDRRSLPGFSDLKGECNNQSRQPPVAGARANPFGGASPSDIVWKGEVGALVWADVTFCVLRKMRQ